MRHSDRRIDISTAILAGGLGTRLRSVANHRPKVMAEICGRPFIHYLLEMLHSRGIRYVVLCVGYLGQQIEAYVGDGAWLGLEVVYSCDNSQGNQTLLGTAGAIRNALSLLGTHFLVINGDTFLDMDYYDLLDHYRANQSTNLMVVYKNQDRWWPSNVVLANGLVRRYNKHSPTAQMRYIDAGVAILQAEAFETEDNINDLPVLYEKLAAGQKLSAYQVRQRFYEINTQTSFAITAQYLQTRVANHCFSGYPES